MNTAFMKKLTMESRYDLIVVGGRRCWDALGGDRRQNAQTRTIVGEEPNAWKKTPNYREGSL